MAPADDESTAPRYDRVDQRIRVKFEGVPIADTTRVVRALQGDIAPVYYVPREDVRMQYLDPTDNQSHCRYKGDATYFTVVVGEQVAPNAAWTYTDPLPEAEVIRDHVAFYAHLVDGSVDGVPAAAPDWKWVGGWELG